MNRPPAASVRGMRSSTLRAGQPGGQLGVRRIGLRRFRGGGLLYLTTTAVTGVEVDGPERDRLWARLNEMFDFDAYQAKVSRRIAVVALTPAD